jgi:O-antigen chain-terminating methyltransferase
MLWYASMFHDGPVLDVGAGRGFFLDVLRERGVECLGVDISEEAATEARGLGVEIIVEDAFSFLDRRSGFAGIFVSHLIEHLEPVRAEELLKAAHRALRPGGTIVVVTPDPRDWLVLSEIFWLDPTHVRPYPTKLIVAMLEAAGFTIEAVGNRNLDLGRRHIPATILNRIRFGGTYARGEAWIRAHQGA